MKAVEKGRVVISTAGHDAGKSFVVLRDEGRFLYLSDGGERPLSKPKKKNKRHVRLTVRILSDTMIETDKRLRKALAAFESEGGA